MLNLFKRTLKEKKWALLIFSVAGIAIYWMYIALFPTLSKGISQWAQSLGEFGSGMMQGVGVDPKSLGTFGGFVSTDWFGFLFPILVVALSCSLANSFFAGEIENETIEFLLSQPISRTDLFFGKLLAGIVDITVFVVVVTFMVFPLTKLSNIQIESSRYLKLTAIGVLFGLALLGLVTLFSSVFSKKSSSTMIVAGLVLFMFVFNFIANLVPAWNWLKYISLFHYFDASALLVHNQITGLVWIVLPGVFIVGTLLGLYLFNKRDITV